MEDFENDFANLRKKQQLLLQDGKADDAKKINETIIDMLALFDGIALYQSTKNYEHLFEDPDKVHLQDAAKTMRITLPVSLDSKDNNPTRISCYSGAYDKSELDQYLAIMEKELGENSFSLTLHSARHAINLNYDAKSKHWLLIDPNILPGEEYTDTGLLADALLSGYGQKEGLVMETSVYATSKHAISVKSNFLSMKKTPEWINLHSPSKLNTVYDDKISQLAYAAERNDNQWIQQNILFNIEFNQADINGFTPLMRASETGAIDVVATLIVNHTDIDQKDKVGMTALMYAASGRHSNIVERLIKSGARIDEVTNDGETALMKAAGVSGNLDSIKLLIRPENVNIENNQGETALSRACLIGDVSIVQFLLDSSAKPTENMLTIECVKGDVDVITTLINNGVKPTEKMLTTACSQGKVDVITTLINNGVSPTEDMLSMACHQGMVDVITTLINNGVSPTENILASVCCQGSVDVISTLINNGAIPTKNMLNLACYQGMVDVISTLINNGVKPTEEMLNMACLQRKVDVITILIDNGVKPTPVLLTHEILAMACNENKTKLINILIDNGVSPDDGLFSQVCDEGKLEIAQMLAPKISRDLIGTLGIQNILEKLGVEKKIIDDSITRSSSFL